MVLVHEPDPSSGYKSMGSKRRAAEKQQFRAAPHKWRAIIALKEAETAASQDELHEAKKDNQRLNPGASRSLVVGQRKTCQDERELPSGSRVI
jgi:hypothetical protein